MQTYLVSYTDHTGAHSIIGSVYGDYPATATHELGKFVRRRKDELHPQGEVCLMTEEGGVVGGSKSKVGEHLAMRT